MQKINRITGQYMEELDRTTTYRGCEILQKVILLTKIEKRIGGDRWNTIKLDTQTATDRFSIMEEVLDHLTIKALESYMQVMHNWIDQQLDGKATTLPKVYSLTHKELEALGFK
jgi:hypothetical protein